MAQVNFADLSSGEEVSFTYTFHQWSKADEFPPSFKVQIVYDVDILNDGNPANDDVNYDNNTVVKTGEQINSMF